MRVFTLNDIRFAVSNRAFDRGRTYQRQGRAHVVEIADEGRSIWGTVQGSSRRPYDVEVDIERDGGEAVILGACSCPVGFNCKHVAALLLEVAASPQGRVVAAIPTSDGLPSDLRDWVGQLDASLTPATDDYPPDVRHRLLYVLVTATRPSGPPQVGVLLRSVRLLKDGRYSDHVSKYHVESIYGASPAKYLRPVDHTILRTLALRRGAMVSMSAGDAEPLPDGEESADLLTRIVGTGRCHWQDVTGPRLSLAEARKGMPRWSLLDDGSQRFGYDAGPGAVTLPLSPPWYVDPANGSCGPLETALQPRLAATLMKAPPVPPAAVPAVRRALAERLGDRLELQPQELAPVEQVRTRPRPQLRLMQRTFRYRWSVAGYGFRPMDRGADLTVGRLAFDYDGIRIPAATPAAEPTVVRDGHVYAVRRDTKAESNAIERAAEFGFKPAKAQNLYELPPGAAGDLVLPEVEGSHALLRFLHRGVPTLQAEGWTVEIDDALPVRLVEADDWTAELSEGSGIDWFELDLGITVDGQRLNLVPALVHLLRVLPADWSIEDVETLGTADGDVFVALADGTVAALSAERLRPILAALYGLFEAGGIDDDGRIHFATAHAAELAALEEATEKAAGLRWLGGERLRALGRKLRDFRAIASVATPPTFHGQLRGYQQEGLSWLQFLRECGLGGVLADDMGLGKTVQALAHLVEEKERGRMDCPSVVVAPTSLMANWRLEAGRFAPSLRVLTLHGPDRKNRFGEIARHDLVLTTYPLLARDRDVLLEQDWHIAILDEAHVIKNPKAAVTKVAQLLRTRHRLCLTGTPVENHLGELWSLFHFLSPGLLGDWKHFTKTFRTPIEKLGDRQRQEHLNRRVRPFLLRRTKADVASELPAKSELVEPIEMGAGQRDLYESVRLAMHKKVRETIALKGLARSHIVVLDALLKLRQTCCDPRLVKLSRPSQSKAQSAKLERLTEMVPELLDEGRRILLFSQFTSMLALIGEALDTAKIPFVQLTGSTKDRETPIQHFQAGEVPLFLISLKAGGMGLNLTAADTVIHYDPWWNPAVETQATDRAHRIGQDKPVFVHKLIVLGSIEEKMLELQQRKRALAEGLFDPDAKSAAGITEDDVAFLFEPV